MLNELKYDNPINDSDINIEILIEHFDTVCVLDSNKKYNVNNHLQFSKLIAIGSTNELVIKNSKGIFEQLQEFYTKRNGWLFGFFTYDLKNNIEQLFSKNEDGLNFPLLHFFSPKVVFQINDNITSVFYDDDFVSKTEAEQIYSLSSSKRSEKEKNNVSKINIQGKITKGEYIDAVNQLKKHIHKGDIYEINFCQEFFAENAKINTVDIYNKLNEI